MTVFTFVLFLIGFAAIGIYSSKHKKKQTEDYLLAGQSVKPWLVALSAVATNNSGYMFIGMIGYTYTYGLSSIWLMIGWILGDFVASILIYKNMRVISGEGKLFSFGSIVAYRNGKTLKWVQFVVGLFSLVFLSVYAAAQLSAGSKALMVTLDWDLTVGVVVGAILVLAYCYSGGIRASIWTDAAQSIVMIIAMGLLMLKGVQESGGMDMAIQKLNFVEPNYMDLFPQFKQSLGAFSPFLFVLGWFFAGFGVVGQPHIMVRYMTLDSADKMNEVRWYYYGWFIAFYFMTISVGLLARILIPVASDFDPELALPTLSMALFPDYMVGIMLAGIFAATISTADSLVISCTAAITNDLIPKLKHNYNLSKLCTAIVTVFAVCVALFDSSSVFTLVIYSWAVLGSAFAPLLTLIMLKKNPDQVQSLTMIFTGAIIAVVWNKAGLGDYVYEMLPGILSGFLVHLMFKARNA